jgi:NADH-quinone oxidoreductase subunit C
VADLRRPRSPARGLGRRRPLTAPLAVGALVRALTDRFPELSETLWTDEDTVEVTIPGDRNVEVLLAVRDEADLRFWWLSDAAAVDYGPGGDDPRFEVVYHLYSDQHPAWLRVRARVDRADPRIASITGLWEGAMFHEREMYDMMGIVFEGNRDLRRIFMSPDYRSFPQRKDFLLPDDAADSAAAGVVPLERPETWDLARFRESLTTSADATPSPAATYAPTEERAGVEQTVESGETEADKSRPR